MRSEDYNDNTGAPLSGVTTLIALIVFLLMEFPIRLWLQPDPWLLGPSHWYFNQPLRLIVELLLIALLFIVTKILMPQRLGFKRKHLQLLIISMLCSALLFALLEFKQLQSSLATSSWLWLAWLVTGFCIGVGQELLYRGLLFTSLTRYFSSLSASIVTTAVFVITPLHSVRLWHYAEHDKWLVVIILIITYLAASTFFQWLRNYTQSVTVPALVHGVGNAITWVAVFA